MTKPSYSDSKVVMLAGPIEWWWNTPEDPDRFNSDEACEYRRWRQHVNDAFVEAGFLVYRPHEAFKGRWNERMQALNDIIVHMSDIVIDMSPYGIPGEGTKHEIALAHKLGKTVYHLPPGSYFEMRDVVKQELAPSE